MKEKSNHKKPWVKPKIDMLSIKNTFGGSGAWPEGILTATQGSLS